MLDPEGSMSTEDLTVIRRKRYLSAGSAELDAIEIEIERMDNELGLTDEEKKEAWQLAHQELAEQESHDEVLEQRYSNLPHLREPTKSISEEAHAEVITRMGEEVDMRLQQERGEGKKK